VLPDGVLANGERWCVCLASPVGGTSSRPSQPCGFCSAMRFVLVVAPCNAVRVWSRFGLAKRVARPSVRTAVSVGGGLLFLYLGQLSLRVPELPREIVPLISYPRRVLGNHLDNLSLPWERGGRRGRPQSFNGPSKLADLFSQSGDFCR
jgi:hypothetical protein